MQTFTAFHSASILLTNFTDFAFQLACCFLLKKIEKHFINITLPRWLRRVPLASMTGLRKCFLL
jgi:hypothetical protein